MGEAVGDLFAIEMLNEYGFVPTGDENRCADGAYATGNKLRGIRNYAGELPVTGAFPTPSTYPQVDPLNFSDIGYDVTGPEVHADGEIWIAINFDISHALAAKYNAQFPESDQALQTRCADGAAAGQPVPGQPALDPAAVRLVPARPDRAVDGRRAQLDARRRPDAVFGGANQNELWRAFARRGLGDFASSTNGTGRARRRVRHRTRSRTSGRRGRQRDGQVRRGQPPGAGAGGQRADLRRPLRGAHLAGRRHRSGHERAGGRSSTNNLDDTATSRRARTSSSPPRPATARSASGGRSGPARPDDHAAHGAQLGVAGPGLDRLRRRRRRDSPTNGNARGAAGREGATTT